MSMRMTSELLITWVLGEFTQCKLTRPIHHVLVHFTTWCFAYWVNHIALCCLQVVVPSWLGTKLGMHIRQRGVSVKSLPSFTYIISLGQTWACRQHAIPIPVDSHNDPSENMFLSGYRKPQYVKVLKRWINLVNCTAMSTWFASCKITCCTAPWSSDATPPMQAAEAVSKAKQWAREDSI